MRCVFHRVRLHVECRCAIGRRPRARTSAAASSSHDDPEQSSSSNPPHHARQSVLLISLHFTMFLRTRPRRVVNSCVPVRISSHRYQRRRRPAGAAQRHCELEIGRQAGERGDNGVGARLRRAQRVWVKRRTSLNIITGPHGPSGLLSDHDGRGRPEEVALTRARLTRSGK